MTVKKETSFKKNFKEGIEGEAKIYDHYEKVNGWKPILFGNDDDKFDFIMEHNDGKQYKHEIKSDDYCTPKKDSGNIFIETASWERNTGIMTTDADYFDTYFKNLEKDNLWSISMNDLRILVTTDENFGKGKIKYCDSYNDGKTYGDIGSNTCGFLIPREYFRKYFIVSTVINE